MRSPQAVTAKTCPANRDGYHRPDTDGEPYNELGATWQQPTCKCGRLLPARRISDIATGAKPPKGRR